MARITIRVLRRQFYSLFYTAFFLIIFPLAITAFSPIYLFRFLLCILAKLIRSDLDKIIPPRSSVLAIDDPYKAPKWNLCIWIAMEGNLNFEHFRDVFFKEKILNKKSEDGQLVYPEYQQYYTSWLGFLFWKWDKKFRLENHMRYYYEGRSDHKNRVTTADQVRKIVKELTWAPFPEKRSPWEMMFIPNYKSATNESEVEPKSVLIYRVHHGLCDGFKILHLLMTECNDGNMNLIAKPDCVQRSFLARIWLASVFCLKAPYQLSKILVTAKDRNQWHRLPEHRLVRPMNMDFTNRIPMNEIKALSRGYKVSFTAVLLSSISGGIRRMMIESGVPIPKNISSAFPVPMPGHPLKLRNNFIFSFIKLPIRIQDGRKRLYKMEKNVRTLKKSTAPILTFGILPLVGRLNAGLQRLFNDNIYSTALLSNFPGPANTEYFTAGGGANKVIDINFGAGFGGGNVGLGFLMTSYAGGIRIVSQADRAILRDEDTVAKLNNFILEEIELLKQEIIV